MPPILVCVPRVAELDLSTVFSVGLGRDNTGRDRGPAFRLEHETADCPVCGGEHGGVSVLRYLGRPADWTLSVWVLLNRMNGYSAMGFSHRCTDRLRRLLNRLHGPPTTFREIARMHAPYRRIR